MTEKKTTKAKTSKSTEKNTESVKAESVKAESVKAKGKTFKVRLYRSINGIVAKQKATVLGLGLKKIGQISELIDTKENRGMANKVSHLVEIL